jgi:hypothetical protein
MGKKKHTAAFLTNTTGFSFGANFANYTCGFQMTRHVI